MDLTPRQLATPKQLECLRFVAEYIVANGYPPRYRDISQALRATTENNARSFVRRLASRGLMLHGKAELSTEVRCMWPTAEAWETLGLTQPAERSFAAPKVGPQRNERHGHNKRSTGPSATYGTWSHMLRRCLNPKNKSYSNYGGRGIRVCAEWMTFENFLRDMGERPSGDFSLDRINNDGGYEPGNCRWATRAQQAVNKRNNLRITLGETTLTPAEWSRLRGIPAGTIYHRLQRGVSSAVALANTRYRHKLTADQVGQDFAERSRVAGGGGHV